MDGAEHYSDHVRAVPRRLKTFKCTVPGCTSELSKKGDFYLHMRDHATHCRVCILIRPSEIAVDFEDANHMVGARLNVCGSSVFLHVNAVPGVLGMSMRALPRISSRASG